MRITPIALSALLVFGAAACGDDGDDSASADEPTASSVEIISPSDGETVSSPLRLEMAAEGIDIEPAGEVIEGAGHFHLMIDVGCVEVGETIPADTEGYNHFGDGSTESELELEPGEHELCLQIGDGEHTALDSTDTITITVED